MYQKEQAKVDYVKSQKQTRRHECHWPDCKEQVPPAMWGCKKHWFKLPKRLRDRVWATYRPGQEKDFNVSDAYIKVAREVQDWIKVETCEKKSIKNRDYKLALIDTDSMGLYKQDSSPWTEEEKKELLTTLNSLMEEKINWDDDGVYNRILVIKTKNYVTDDGEIKFSGSAFKDTKKEIALKEMLTEISMALFEEKDLDYIIEIYNKYVKEAMNITDISRWVAKKTITSTLFESKRANETKVVDAIGDMTVQEGDKIYTYNAIDGEKQVMAKGEPQFYKNGEPKMESNCILKLQDKFDGKYDVTHYIERCYKTMEILREVLDPDEEDKKYDSKGRRKLTKKILNYKLAKNKKLLENL